jgi:hypothetical protein
MLNILKIACAKTEKATKEAVSKMEIFCNQLVDSLIVGGIAGFSAFVASGEAATFKVFGLAFALTFLVKMKDYRGIKE